MQAGAPTAVMFLPDMLVSKFRNLGKDKPRTHGWITSMVATGRFRENGVQFRVTPVGRDFLAGSKLEASS
jgi:hypothetical protein